MEPAAMQDIPDVEEVYERLAQTLQYNKNLKVLLWGNKLPDPGNFWIVILTTHLKPMNHQADLLVMNQFCYFVRAMTENF